MTGERDAGAAQGAARSSRATGLIATLLVTVATPAIGAQAGAAPPPPAPAPADAAASADARPPQGEYVDAEGKPLSPEKQQELRERFKDAPPTVVRRREGAVSADGSLVVAGRRPRGSIVGDIPPQRTFNPQDIRAYGSDNISELLKSLGSQVSSNQGREDSGPVVLLNGKRVSSFAEIAKIPTEAIERLEVFPEEVALKYGYRADQKVVNVVAFQRFSSQIAGLSTAVPSEGGRHTVGATVNYLRISGDTRLNVDADYGRSGALLESERNVRQVSATPDGGRFRSLLPNTERLAVNGTISGTLLRGISSTVNGTLEANDSDSLLGAGLAGPLTRNVDTLTTHLGTAAGGRLGKWPWTFTANYDRGRTETRTDTSLGDAADRSRFVNQLADAALVVNGALAELPAGPASASFRAGGRLRDFASRSVRAGVAQASDLARTEAGVQATLDVPITSRARKHLSAVGTVSANVNFAVDEVSDVGTLRSFGYGLRWSPTQAVSLIAAVTDEEGAPAIEQLGAPLIETPNVRTFDFTRREVVDITRVTGGNRDLGADRRRVFKIGANISPLAKTDFVVSLNYVKTRIDDPTATFPIATPQIEAAFPERFTRDADGRLLRIDSRPLSFSRSDQERFRWGLNLTRPLGPVPPGLKNATPRFVGSEADLQNALPSGARIIKAEPGTAAARDFENLSSRLTLSFYHTLTLVDEIRTRDGGPTLDLLDGSATAARGGSPRHELELQAGLFKRGIGVRSTVNWRSGTRVRGLSPGPLASNGDLIFSAYTIANVTIFANLERLMGANARPWVKGVRVSAAIANVFNARPEVRDDAGATPLSYQPAYLDPLGRIVSFSLRKIF